MATTLGNYIEVSEGTRGGKPCLAGTRFAVDDVVLLHLRMGQSIEQIAGHYRLSLAALHAAMSYYYDHRAEVDARIEAEDAYFAAARQANPSLLQAKLKALAGG